MNKDERNITALWDLVALFTLMASVGSAYHGQWIAALGYVLIFLVIYFEKPIRRWFSKLRF